MNTANLIKHYFPEITPLQQRQFEALHELYNDWNSKVNVISRKDIDQLYVNHVLHALAIAKVVQFKPNTEVLDVGTGGGFPGIPLAILFPKTTFHLVDSIGKKIMVVNKVIDALKLKNTVATQIRAEDINQQYDFIVSRAVTELSRFYAWVKGKIKKKSSHDIPNGILYLKGGDLTEEIAPFKKKITLHPITNWFKEPYFESKMVLHFSC